MILWADMIFVMEKKHRQRIRQKFGEASLDKDIIVLDIPDEYQYMDPELVEILEVSVMAYFETDD